MGGRRYCALGLADGVVTEDGDILASLVACRASRCVFVTKLDRYGNARVLRQCGDLRSLAKDATGAFGVAARGMAQNGCEGAREFVQACVLAGCDYAKSRASRQ